jgi:hypothetical protein
MALSKPKIIRTVRNIAISFVVILVIAVGTGAAYTWYMGTQKVASTVVAEPVVTTSPVIKPTKPAENASVGVSVQSLLTPITPGSNTSITIRTTPSATCIISVVYNDVPSTDSGLKAQQADDFGMATWTWTVGPSVPLGKWPVKVTCTYNKKSGVVQGDLVVANAG